MKEEGRRYSSLPENEAPLPAEFTTMTSGCSLRSQRKNSSSNSSYPPMAMPERSSESTSSPLTSLAPTRWMPQLQLSTRTPSSTRLTEAAMFAVIPASELRSTMTSKPPLVLSRPRRKPVLPLSSQRAARIPATVVPWLSGLSASRA
ncbi:hypothetical protein D3C76_1210120 [compost metagenome]